MDLMSHGPRIVQIKLWYLHWHQSMIKVVNSTVTLRIDDNELIHIPNIPLYWCQWVSRMYACCDLGYPSHGSTAEFTWWVPVVPPASLWPPLEEM